MGPTLLWYDLETFGLHRSLDRIAQFAALRTDIDLNPIEDPVVLYSKITPDYVPDPMACLLTGITPKTTLEKGLPELEFTGKIHEQFARPGTCVAGYNNIQFDDEFIRNTLYRNLYDPFYREWAGGNSRWDIINVLRAARDLRPEGINWPVKEDKTPSFKLETLTKANGIPHEGAHDALSDVYATIALAKLLSTTQPKLFNYLFDLRRKEQVKALIDLHKKPILLYTSETFTSPFGCTAPIIPVSADPHNHNAVLCVDLRGNPSELAELSVDQIKEKLFTPANQLPAEAVRIPLVKLHVNKSPALAPISVLDEDTAHRLHINTNTVEKKAQFVRSRHDLTQKLMEVFRKDEPPRRKDPELEIYGGFFSDSDRDRMASLRSEKPQKMLARRFEFDDPRIPPLVWRMVCRNYPETLDAQTQKEWRSFCAGRLLFPPERMINDFHFFTRKIAEYSQSRESSPRDKLILRDLQEWADTIKRDVLSYEQ
ncbi:MAG: exodeoxyribonuclease I [Spirochaetaceae bacterium]